MKQIFKAVRPEKGPTLNETKSEEGQLQVLTCNLLPKLVRHDKMEGRDFLVVPMIILTEGVHNGSDGPLLYPKEELSKTPDVWNYKPVVVYHPEMNGVGVSACSPEIITSRKVGVMMNTKFEKGKLKSEAWIEVTAANKVDDRIMKAIESNTMMELSTGVFVDNDKEEGEWKKEDYVGVARNYRPDHLALLPDKIGACSIKDGAGFLRNQEDVKRNSIAAVFAKVMRDCGLVENELSHSNIRESLGTELRKKFAVKNDNGPYLFVEDVYADFCVYEWDRKLFRIGYTANNTTVALDKEAPVEVKRVTEYRTVEGAFVGNRDQTTNNQNSEITMNKKELVDGLIKNSKGLLVEADRERLMAFNEDQLKKLTFADNAAAPAEPKEKADPAPAPVKNEQAPEPKKQEPAPAAAPAPVTLQSYIGSAPKEIQDVLHNGMAVYNEEKTKLIEGIVANKNNGFTKEELGAKSLNELRNLSRLAGVESIPVTMRTGNYSGQGRVPETTEAEEVLDVPVLNFAAKK